MGLLTRLVAYCPILVKDRGDLVGCCSVPGRVPRDGCQVWNKCFTSTRDM
jgi:hypothetical protein